MSRWVNTLRDALAIAMLVLSLWLMMYIVASYTVPEYIQVNDYTRALQRVGWMVR